MNISIHRSVIFACIHRDLAYLFQHVLSKHLLTDGGIETPLIITFSAPIHITYCRMQLHCIMGNRNLVFRV